MIAGATYRSGVAYTPDGAVYVYSIASGAVVPPTAAGSGAKISPMGQKVTDDGALYVRFA
jgi:hypothetical protein